MTDPLVLPEAATNTCSRTKKQPPFAVILHNDDINTMQWVTLVLRKTFGYSIERCTELMLEAHQTGRTVVWVGAMELAELKADQIVGCGPDPAQLDRGAEPLRVTIEPTE